MFSNLNPQSPIPDPRSPLVPDSHSSFIRNVASADLAVCENADSFLQSAMWGLFKSRFGWKANAFTVEWAVDGDTANGDTANGDTAGGVKPLLVLSRRVAPAVVMAYCPWGPELPAADPVLRADTAAELARALRPHFRGAAFIRFDPPWWKKNEQLEMRNEKCKETLFSIAHSPDPRSPIPDPFSFPTPFKRASADIQPPDTVLVDLSPSVQEILAAMKPKWRYNIGLAEKRGVVVRCNDGAEEDLDIFYRLFTETAARDGIAIHGREYYRALIDVCKSGGKIPSQLRLYIAEHEGNALAAIMVLCRGKQAVYLYGASANIKRNVMAPYALQWKAMQDAKALGCEQYDLFGIPPDENPAHPMAGLYRFKTGFGGKIIHRPGSWDYPYKPVLYALFSAAERLRKKLKDSRKRHGAG